MLAEAKLERDVLERLRASKTQRLDEIAESLRDTVVVLVAEAKIIRVELDDGVWLAHPDVPLNDVHFARHAQRVKPEPPRAPPVNVAPLLTNTIVDSARRALILQAWGVPDAASVASVDDAAFAQLCDLGWAERNPVISVKAPAPRTAAQRLVRYRLTRDTDLKLSMFEDDMLTVAFALQAKRGIVVDADAFRAVQVVPPVWLLPSGLPLDPVLAAVRARLCSFVVREPSRASAEESMAHLIGANSARCLVDMCLASGLLVANGEANLAVHL